jgi:general secretion pathway protein G
MLAGVNSLGRSRSTFFGKGSGRGLARSRWRNHAVQNHAPQNKASQSKAQRYARGFTLLEMMIVLSIIIILMAIAIPNYNRTVIQSRESVLRSNLSTLRSVISQYTLDKQKAPQSLDDLVQAGYLRQIPVDPMTKETNWEVKQEDVLMAVDQQDPGIDDVHSASSGTAIDGTAYSTW